MVATSNTTATINAANGATVTKAISGMPFTFASGVPALNATGTTTLTVTTPAAGTPTFTMTADNGAASGTLGFGSCIFIVETSTIPGLNVGDEVVVDPCQITVDTAGKVANGAPETQQVSVVLGGTVSRTLSLPVVITPSGQVSVNGVTLGTAPVSQLTGTIS